MQNNNTRRNRRLTYRGHTLTVAQWAEVVGLSQNTLENRVWRGWSTEEALTIPKGRRRPTDDERSEGEAYG